MKSQKNLISIIVPVFNEEENVRALYEAVKKELEKNSNEFDFEFIFTDNRSTDSTFTALKDLARSDSRVRAARFSRNFGYQKSIYTGFCLAQGNLAIEIDCDLQDPPELIHTFIAKWKEGYEVVYGVRTQRKENPFMTFVRQSFYKLINLLSEDELPLDAGDFRLVDRKVLNQLKLTQDANPYLRGAIASLGFNQIGVPYERNERKRGRAKFDLKSMTSLALDGILNHSVVPLRVATFTGMLVSSALVLYFLTLSFLSFFFRLEWPRGFATMSVLILISISLNAIFLGIIGEYLGRIYRQIKRYPITVIDQTINLEGDFEKDSGIEKSNRFVNL